MRRLLKRQLAKAFAGSPPRGSRFERFLKAVEEAYQQCDDDREMLERSLELSSNELLRRNAEMQAVLQAFPDTVLWVDARGRVAGVKPGLGTKALLAGAPRGRPLAEAFAAGPPDGLDAALAAAATGEDVSSLEHAVVTQDGLRHFELRLSGASGGMLVVVIRDVTALRSARASLLETQRQYEAIFENSREGLYLSAMDGALLRVNPAMARICGFALAKEVVDVLNWKELYAAPGARKAFLRRLFETGELVDHVSRLRRSDGSVIWISENARLVRDRDGRPRYIEGSVTDVSERKAAEIARKKARRELERRVAERTAELVAANASLTSEVKKRKKLQARYKEAMEAAEAANASKTDFLNTVSHELRTPLTSVIGFAKIIRKKLLGGLFRNLSPRERVAREQAVVAENLEIIIAEGERLTSLINDLLDIAKLESGRAELLPAMVDLAEVARRAAEAAASLFREKRLELRLELAPVPPIVADRDKLVQVLINLLSNAVKFTDAGRVTCRLRSVPGRVVVEVEDTGTGIPKERQAGIFEKFVQSGATLTDRPRGTGLGLAICRNIVRLHGGDIGVRSEPGKGSLFLFDLPVDRSLLRLPDSGSEGEPSKNGNGGE